MTAPMDGSIQDGLIDTAKRVLPGGTFGNMAGDVVIREGRAGRVWDENGKEYVDFLLGSGPMLVGHAHPEVTAAAQARIAQGTTFFANNRWGIELAEAIVDAVPCAEQVRFVSTGSEADLYAMRAARAFTRRDKDPQVRGRLSRDERLFADEPGAEALGQFPRGRARLGRHPALLARRDADRAVQQHRGRRRAWCASIATNWPAVIVEPFQRIIPPAPGFLAGAAQASPRKTACR